MVSGCGDLNGNACEITFPVYKVNQTEYNADAFNITPFKMHITLPQNVYIKNVKDMTLDEKQGGNSMIYACEDKEIYAYIDYGIYKPDKDFTPKENYYRHVLSDWILSSFVNWGSDYTFISQNDKTVVGECEVCIDNHDGSDIITHQGILVYNDELGVYVKIEFESNESDEELEKIAKSIRLDKE